MNNLVIETIFKRRSIRKYKDQPVEKEKLELILKAAMAAPSACNNQPWEFVVITNPEKMNEFYEQMPYGKYKAPAAIVVLGNPEKGKVPHCQKYWEQDCSAALENMLIAAASLDLGTVWLGVYRSYNVETRVKELLTLPEHIIPMAVVYVGYPDEEKEPGTKYEDHRVHWEAY